MALIEDIVQLPISQRVKLVEDIWDSIAADQSGPDVTDEQRHLIRERLREYRANPEDVEDWAVVLDRLRSR